MRLSTSLVGLAFVAGAFLAPATAQDGPAKRPLTHDDYDQWKSIAGSAFSRDGAWAAWREVPQRGDGELVVRSTDGATTWRVAIGSDDAVGGDDEEGEPRRRRGGGASGPAFTADGRFVVFRVEPTYREKLDRAVRRLVEQEAKRKARERGEGGERGERAGRGERGERGRGAGGGRREGGEARGRRGQDEAPEGHYALLDVTTGTVEELADVKSFRVTEEAGAFLVLHLEEPEEKGTGKEGEEPGKGEETGKAEEPGKGEETGKAEEPGKGEQTAKGEEPEPAEPAAEESKPEKWRKDGTILIVRNLARGTEQRFLGVTDYGLADEAGWLWFARNSEEDDPAIERGLFALRLGTERVVTLVAGAAEYAGFALDEEETRLAFYSNRNDREAEEPQYDVFAWDFEAEGATRIVSRGHAAVPRGQQVARQHRLDFSRDGGVLLFATEPPDEEDLPELLPNERVVVDIWHWKDPLLQPMQEKQQGALRSERIVRAFHFDDGRIVPITVSPFEDTRFLTPDGSRVLVSDSSRYAPDISWDGRYSDYHVVNALDGSRRTVLERCRGSVDPSPDGRYLLHFDGEHWQCIDLVESTTAVLTAEIDRSFAIEDWDTPQPARPYGVMGWTPGEERVLLYDRHDVWKVAPDGTKAACVTDGLGRQRGLEFRWQRLDREQRFVPVDEPVLLATRDLETMATGFYEDRVDGLGKPEPVTMKDMRFSDVEKAEAADRLFFTLETFERFPDLWTANLDLTEPRQLSTANPQQERFRWGKAELVRWRSLDGVPLKGVLVKPEGFDPERRYPLMVYFYERRSQNLHAYVPPAPTTSPRASYYVSNGYLWFEPDIVYREGYPGESCLDCVVPGVLALVEQGFVDATAIGAAGHSWGGYQTAYLITKTDLFAAVESGAPVSNMTSAYGGIRWSTGMSRAFQYERTQSRIGGSLWEYPLRFLENSPIFFADKVRTPILMLHNDADGAVPWYQGIEYFCALRRLGKEAYMLNYCGEGHGLRERQDMLDWTIRMQQFFDHHLRGAPLPRWMAEGVEYAERAREKLDFRPPESVRIRAELEAAGVEAVEASSTAEVGSAER